MYVVVSLMEARVIAESMQPHQDASWFQQESKDHCFGMPRFPGHSLSIDLPSMSATLQAPQLLHEQRAVIETVDTAADGPTTPCRRPPVTWPVSGTRKLVHTQFLVDPGLPSDTVTCKSLSELSRLSCTMLESLHGSDQEDTGDTNSDQEEKIAHAAGAEPIVCRGCCTPSNSQELDKYGHLQLVVWGQYQDVPFGGTRPAGHWCRWCRLTWVGHPFGSSDTGTH